MFWGVIAHMKRKDALELGCDVGYLGSDLFIS